MAKEASNHKPFESFLSMKQFISFGSIFSSKNEIDEKNQEAEEADNALEDIEEDDDLSVVTLLDDLNQVQRQVNDLEELAENYQDLKHIKRQGAFKDIKEELDNLKKSIRRGRSEKMDQLEIDHPNFIAFDEDTYSLMMMSPMFSRYWALGLISVMFQWSILILILIDLIVKQSKNSSVLGIPYSVPYEVTIGQFLGIFICVGVQTDVLSSIRIMFAMRNSEETNWDEVIRIDKEKRTWKTWMIQIFFPNMVKFISGLLVLAVNFITIVQSGNIVDLMKDVAALLIISEISEIFFTLGSFGFLGEKIEDATELVQGIEVEDKLMVKPICGITIPARLMVCATLIAIMMGAVGFFIEGQKSGRYFKDRYPYCTIGVENIPKFGNGRCDGGIYNTIACDFDGGDCLSFNLQYPNCNKALEPWRIGDGKCDEIFSTPECGFDGNDCCPFNTGNSTRDPRYGDGICDGGIFFTKLCQWDEFDCNDVRAKTASCNYEELSGLVPFGNEPRLGDGKCDSQLYNTPDCLFENGDCIECNSKVYDYTLTGDGICHGGPHNTLVCNNDAGDCDSFNTRWPDCQKKTIGTFSDNIKTVPIIGDGICNSGIYNNVQCGYEDGDCHECNSIVPNITKIGDGFCDGQEYMSDVCGFDGGDCLGCNALRFEIGDGWCSPEYNTPECSFDGGDCDMLRDLPDCDVPYPSLLGNGYCNGAEYNTEACDWDGGDCLEVKLEGCDEPDNRHFLLGDGYCNGFMNTPECNFDGGDCDSFNELYPNCTFVGLEPSLIGNGVCNRGRYNSLECGWDGRDCLFDL